MSRLREWLLAVFRGRRADAEMHEEMLLHVELEAEENRRRGMGEADAWRAARLKFGGAEQFMEEVRDARGARGLLDIGRDFRIAARGLRRSPLLTAVVILALAIGIGATTAVFALVNRMLLRPLPGVTAPEELVMIRMQEDELNYTGISYVTFNDLRYATSALNGYAGYGQLTLQVTPSGGQAVVLRGEAVVGDYFGTLGVEPVRGRLFTPDELSPGGDPYRIVLREDVAARLYDGAEAVGRTMRANGHSFTVVGVVPRTFRGVERTRETEAWVPPGAYAPLNHMEPALTTLSDRRFSPFMQQFGRVAPGATGSLVQAQLRQRMSELIRTYPDDLAIYEEQPPTVSGPLGLGPAEREGMRTMLLLLFGVSVLVLVIACANVANLLTFRGVVRRGEAAIRRALGASFPRLLQQNVAEGLLIAIAGAAGGAAVAMLLTRLLAGGAAAEPMAAAIVDVRVLCFAIGVACAVSLLFAAVPTLMTRGVDLVTTLRQSSRGETGRVGVFRGALVVLQLASSVALLVGGLLMGRTMRALSDVELGFDAEHTVAFSIQERSQGYDDERLRALQQRLVERASDLPDVQAVSLSRGAPFVSAFSIGRLRDPSWPADRRAVSARAAWVSPAYFQTLGIPVLRGRAFTPAEASASDGGVIILSRAAALELFGGVDVVGRVVAGGFIQQADRTVIGVVEDVRHDNLRGEMEPGFYEPLASDPLSGFELVVRTAGPRASVESGVRSVMRQIDPELPFSEVSLMTQRVQDAVARERFIGRATLVLAALAGFLAAIGLYGLLAYSVAQQRREIGIRIALGARPLAVVAWVTARMLSLTAVGLILGLAGGFALGSALRSQLYGVEPLDMFSYAAAAIILLAIGGFAAALPARAAVGVDPARALRAD